MPGSPLELPERATATRWVDGLTVLDAEVLAAYDHPHFRRWPAVTTRHHGAGQVTCVGTVPGRDLSRSLATWLAPAPSSDWQNLPPSVTATTGTSAASTSSTTGAGTPRRSRHRCPSPTCSTAPPNLPAQHRAWGPGT
ncbi:beta-galactosidase trimerization domain-containing protein [Streptomyces canus]|uniref:beta-galactosidase trimerization domain-containing protein n=1 Tax=Streptomyces canus TaxID=58343 RepID=UPI0036E6873E